jgi:divalent metal cation (Fe/Co/Zn/Cd) transporter
VAARTPARKEKLHRRGLLLEWFTVAWNVVEAVVAIGVGLVVGSVALVGFGVDSGIEVISAVALLWRLYRAGPNASAEEHGEAVAEALHSKGKLSGLEVIAVIEQVKRGEEEQ